jgi:citrate lyase subunit beta/citryl-CoA lyase
MGIDLVTLPKISIDHVRSLLFVPADRPDFIRGVLRSAPDGIVFDLQDSVAPERKSLARQQLGHLSDTFMEGVSRIENRPYLCVRINPCGGGIAVIREDVRAVIESRVDGVVIPEVHSLADILAVDASMTEAISNATSAHTSRPELLVLLETPESIDLVDEIVDLRTESRIGALLYGREDLTDHMGVPLRYEVDWKEPGTIYPRLRVIWAAKRRHLPVLDSTPTILFETDIVESESTFGRDIGFTGRGCIHPAQVPVIDRSYSPTEAEVARSRRAADAYRETVAAGKSVVVSDGAMVDRPIVLLHEKVLAKAELVRIHNLWKDQWRQAALNRAGTST